ncbi:alkaline phosphatase [Geobacillus sp. TFV-3]|uniref:alkaline phosphatase n=1 Tax=Geobacillus sp. TFV-3 TaxID=1897059 RepID=UPI002E2B4688|nr:alkaline phosphatase [Geobacillus sp. TFV-3]
MMIPKEKEKVNKGCCQRSSSEDGPFAIARSSQTFALDWTTTSHTTADVPLTAMGPGADRFTGIYENTRIHDILEQLLSGKNKR